MSGRACPSCLARAWLIGELAGHLDAAVRRIDEVLALGDLELLAAVAGRRRDELERRLERFDGEEASAGIERAGLEAVCRCDPAYPQRLACLDAPPAVLHVCGGIDRLETLTAGSTVALVGSRRASPYGLNVARSLGRALASAGVPVISGMALGIDTAAHEGALAGGAGTVAVLPGCAAQPYPASRRALHKRITASGAAVSELGPGTSVRRWMFPARNRIIAALADVTVVVEAGLGSGALVTARVARWLGRPVGAVPGQVTSPVAAGCHALLVGGAALIRGPEDVVELLFGPAERPLVMESRPALDDEHRAVLAAVAAGRDKLEPGALAALAWLELAGYVRRELGGRYSVVP
jgi:DNA processing protein